MRQFAGEEIENGMWLVTIDQKKFAFDKYEKIIEFLESATCQQLLKKE